MNNETKTTSVPTNKSKSLQNKLQSLPKKTKLLIIYALGFVIFSGALYLKLLVSSKRSSKNTFSELPR